MTETKYFDEITDPQLTDWLLMQQASEGGITGKVAVGNLPGSTVDISSLVDNNTFTQVVSGLQAEIDQKATVGHEHQILNVDGLASALYDKADKSEVVTTVSGLQAQIDSKAASSHTHQISGIANLQISLDSKANALDVASTVSGLQQTDVDLQNEISSNIATINNTLSSKSNIEHTHPEIAALSASLEALRLPQIDLSGARILPHWHTHSAQANTSQADTLHFLAFWIAKTVRIRSLAISVTQPSSASNAQGQLLLFSIPNHVYNGGTLLANGGNFSLTTAGEKKCLIDVTLSPGWYAAAYNCNTMVTLQSTSSAGGLYWVPTYNAVQTVQYPRKSQVFGTAPNIITGSFLNSISNIPLIWLEIW